MCYNHQLLYKIAMRLGMNCVIQGKRLRCVYSMQCHLVRISLQGKVLRVLKASKI